MKIKIQNRQTGKTYDIAQKMKKYKNSICVVFNVRMKRHFCEVYNISEKRVFSIKEVMMGKLKNSRHKKAYIDEIGACFDVIIPRIEYGTHTNEEV